MTRGSGDATFCGLGKKKVIVQSRKEMLLGLVSCALVKQEKGKKTREKQQASDSSTNFHNHNIAQPCASQSPRCL